MGDPVLQLGNPENWSLSFNETRTAQRIGGTESRPTYAPIAPIELPFLFHSPYLLLLAGSPTAPAYYKSAGYAAQKIQIGSLPGGIPDAYYQARRKVYLRQMQLIRFEKLASTYQFSFFTHYWLDSLELAIWEYIGSTDDTTEQLVSQNIGISQRTLDKLNSAFP